MNQTEIREHFRKLNTQSTPCESGNYENKKLNIEENEVFFGGSEKNATCTVEKTVEIPLRHFVPCGMVRVYGS
jgi:hypothetical protein